MTTTLTAEPLPEVAGVLLTIQGAPAGDLVITRTDANGAATVRLLPDQAPIGGSLTVRDYEAAVTGDVTYSLLGEDASSAPVTVQQTVRLDLAKAVLSVPRRPALRSDAGTVTGWAEANPSSHLVHYVPERPDPIVLGGRQRLRTGTAVLRFPSYLEGAAAKALGDGEVVMLRVPGVSNQGMDWYARIERPDLAPVEVDGTPSPDWELTLPFTEVYSPEAPLSGSADWTIGDAYEAAPTLAASRLAFPTLRDLAVGP
jgi:hypothetical protein